MEDECIEVTVEYMKGILNKQDKQTVNKQTS